MKMTITEEIRLIAMDMAFRGLPVSRGAIIAMGYDANDVMAALPTAE